MDYKQLSHAVDSVEVRQITVPDTYPVRRAVLYPKGPESKIHIPNDEEGTHLGAFVKRPVPSDIQSAIGGADDYHHPSQGMDLIAVISLFYEELPPSTLSQDLPASPRPSKSLRFRKFACLELYQSRGIGSQLFQHVLDFARTDSRLGNGTTVWCDARWLTREWYLRRGMKTLGERFFKGDVEYVVMAIQV